MARFVLLHHQFPPGHERADHFDLMLETTDGLLTWQVAQLPQHGSEQIIRQLPLHRIHYLDHEGPVSGNRGTVQRIDGGTLVWLQQGRDEIQVELEGEKLAGIPTLTRCQVNVHSTDSSADSFWRLSFASASSA